MDLFVPPLPEDELAAQNAPRALRGNAARLERMRKRRRARRLRVAVVAVVLLAGVLAYFTGVYGASLSLLGDVVDSVTIALTPAAGYPISNSVINYKNATELAGGLALLGAQELVLYAPGGNELRRVQHGFANPCVTASNNRVCIYNRGSTELQVESRSRTLYQQTVSDPILLAQMSQNGTLGVFTKSALTVYDSMFNAVWEWRTSAMPLGIAFASDNKNFAVATVNFTEGALGCQIRFFHLANSTDLEQVPTITVESGVPLQMKYLTRNSLLVVFDTFAAVYNTATGLPIYSYNYQAKTLQAASLDAGKNTVLLFDNQVHSAHSTVVVLDDTLKEIGSAFVDNTATTLTATRTSMHLFSNNAVVTYGLDGTYYGETQLEEKPLALIEASRSLLVMPTKVLEFKAPGR